MGTPSIACLENQQPGAPCVPAASDPTFDPIPAALIDPAAEKITRSKHRWFIAEILVYFFIISGIILVYVNYKVFGLVQDYLLFHVLAELFSIVILGSIFIVGWNTRYVARNNFFLVIGVSSLFVAVLDLFHTLAFPGMDFFASIAPENNLSPQIWIAARYFQAITIVMSLLVMRKRVRPFILAMSMLAACAILIIMIATRVFPDAHDGVGLTPFKIASEYIIIGLLCVSTVLVWRERVFFGKGPSRLIFAFLASLIVAELLFTLYVNAYEISNMLGHVFKITAFACIYKAIVQTVLVRPLDHLFKKIVDADRDLEKRNRELVLSNTTLLREIADRERAEKTLRQFMMTIAHEFRTPVTVLDQAVQNLVKYNERMSSDQETALVSSISRNMGIMNDLVENFANIIRLDEHEATLQLSPVDIKATINDVLNAMDNAIHVRNMHVNVSIPDGILIALDGKKIYHVIRALLDNAVKFSPRDSTVAIIVIDHYTGEYNRDGQDGVLVQISDKGMGIDAELLPRLFERFARSSRVKDIPGSGLGLALAKEYVTMHEGKIFVSTQVDKGTTFSIFLPRRKP
ncbi:MAG: hypothetical protein GYA24_01990 [Candidatus Lokiarchaeota archaeon]|nr:hypothetical protein [Candidatus Lokiarchaeota archaeon]